MHKYCLPLLLALAFLQSPAVAKPVSESGFDSSSLDKSVEPSADFYSYANGGWLKKHPIPPEVSEWGRFHTLMQDTAGSLYEIVVKASISKAPQGSLDQKLGDFYRSGTDVDRLDSQGIQPLKRDLEQIRAIKDLKGLETTLISLHRRGIEPFFNVHSTQDARNSQIIIASIGQSGLGLPEPEYYSRTDERSLKQLAAYQEHLRRAFHYLGYPEAEARARADKVFELEWRLAQASLTKVEMRDPISTYHPTTLTELSGGLAGWSWPQYFEGLGLPQADVKLTIDSPKYLDALYGVFESCDLAVLRNYLEWQLLHSSYDYLSEDLAKFRFDFYGKVLSGSPAQPRRNGRVLFTIDRLMRQALARKYVETYFDPKLKVKVKEMVDLLTEALDEDISNLTWMAPSTQVEAHNKLKSLKFKIGHPEVWQDYTGLTISRDSYLENVWRASAYENARDLARIGKPPDLTEWHMSAADVNAAYSPHRNEVFIPAGIIQSPFFSVDEDDALNFGGLGTVIGHEITHGFDDQGRKFDGLGNLRDWWTPADLESFQKLATLVEEQFSAYTVLDGRMSLNGKLVLGESIADLGGLRLSYLAYQKLLKRRPGQTVGGFTPEQRFFLGNARIWATNSRADYQRLQVNVSNHPPGRYRVNGPASNMPEFARAFKCSAGSPMVRAKPIQIW